MIEGGAYKPQFFNPIYDKEIDFEHTKSNLIEAGVGSIAGAILGAALFTVPGALPAGMALAAAMGQGAITGFMPGLVKEGIMQATDPKQTVQGVRGVGQGLKRSSMMPQTAMQTAGQLGSQGSGQEVGPWTPPYMSQMERYG